MSRGLIGLVVGLAVILASGCRDRAVAPEGEESAQQSTIPAQVVASPPSIAIDESKVAPVAGQRLASAGWTRHACSLDMVDNGPPDAVLPKGSPHVFKGFVLGSDGGVAGDFMVLFKGKELFGLPTATGASRPDVAAYFKNPSLSAAGFEFSTTLSSIPEGNYEIVYLMDNGPESFFCESGRKVQVTSAP